MTPYQVLIEEFRVFTKEVFQIIEWAIVVAAIQVAGTKLQIPLASYIGWFLFTILGFYVGLRVEQLVAWARGGERPKPWPGLILPIVAALVFGNALTALIAALGRVSLGGQ